MIKEEVKRAKEAGKVTGKGLIEDALLSFVPGPPPMVRFAYFYVKGRIL